MGCRISTNGEQGAPNLEGHFCQKRATKLHVEEGLIERGSPQFLAQRFIVD